MTNVKAILRVVNRAIEQAFKRYATEAFVQIYPSLYCAGNGYGIPSMNGHPVVVLEP